MKVSDDRVTHHSHQKGAFGLNGEMSFTPTWHEEAPPMCPIGVRSVRLCPIVSDLKLDISMRDHVRKVSGPVRTMSETCPVLYFCCPILSGKVSGMSDQGSGRMCI